MSSPTEWSWIQDFPRFSTWFPSHYTAWEQFSSNNLLLFLTFRSLFCDTGMAEKQPSERTTGQPFLSTGLGPVDLTQHGSRRPHCTSQMWLEELSSCIGREAFWSMGRQCTASPCLKTPTTHPDVLSDGQDPRIRLSVGFGIFRGPGTDPHGYQQFCRSYLMKAQVSEDFCI